LTPAEVAAAARGTISGATPAVTGRQLLELSAAKGVAALALDRPVRFLDDGSDGSNLGLDTP
jgi:hypothetical protein